jgi:hypothetical protein
MFGFHEGLLDASGGVGGDVSSDASPVGLRGLSSWGEGASVLVADACEQPSSGSLDGTMSLRHGAPGASTRQSSREERALMERWMPLPDRFASDGIVGTARAQARTHHAEVGQSIAADRGSRAAAVEQRLQDGPALGARRFVLGREGQEWTLRLEGVGLVWRGTRPGEGKALRSWLEETLRGRNGDRLEDVAVTEIAETAENWDFH